MLEWVPTFSFTRFRIFIKNRVAPCWTFLIRRWYLWSVGQMCRLTVSRFNKEAILITWVPMLYGNKDIEKLKVVPFRSVQSLFCYFSQEPVFLGPYVLAEVPPLGQSASGWLCGVQKHPNVGTRHSQGPHLAKPAEDLNVPICLLFLFLQFATCQSSK